MSSLFVLNPIFMRTLNFLFISAISLASCSDMSVTYDIQTGNKSYGKPNSISADRMARIDTMIINSIRENVIPGAVALVLKDGEVVYEKAWGVSNPETGSLYSSDDIFRIASMTKAITSVAILMLWEEGRFFLDDPIEKYLPAFSGTGILESYEPNDSSYTTTPNQTKITIRHLLTHTSGIGYSDIDVNPSIKAIYWKNGLTDIFSPSLTMKEAAKEIARQPLHHEPGTKFTYSLGIDVLGSLVEEISGMPFADFLSERIFKPLNMNNTYFNLPKKDQNRLVPVLTRDDQEWKIFETEVYDVDYPIMEEKTFFSGGAGLSSTIGDYAKFLRVLIQDGNGNNKQILGKKTCELLYENQLRGIEDWSLGIATGIMSEKDLYQGGRGSVGTLTWGGYFNTIYFADPEEKIIGLLFKQTQNIGNDYTSQRFRELVFQSVVK